MSHHCQALIFRCMDFRLTGDLPKLLAKAGYPAGSYDLVSAAGAGKDLLSAEIGDVNFLLKQIRLSQKLHGIEEIVILYHDNCGAYGLADLAEEEIAQKKDLAEIENLLQANFPELKTRIYIIKGVKEGGLSLQEIK